MIASGVSVRDAGPAWRDLWALEVVRAVGAAADCTRRRVGAALFDSRWRVLGLGYNGAPPGQPGCATEAACPRGRAGYDTLPPGGSYARGPGACIAVHAEDNALRDARMKGMRVEGATAVITDPPCDGCRYKLALAGVHRIVWPGGEWMA